MNIYDKFDLEHRQEILKRLVDKAKQEIVSYEEELKVVADKLKGVPASVVETVQEVITKTEEPVEEVKEEAAPKKPAAKKVPAKKATKSDESSK